MPAKFLMTPLLILLTIVSYAQKQHTRLVLEKVIEHAKTSSLYRENVDWDKLRHQMYDLSKNADSINQLGSAIQLMLKTLNDEHGRVFYNNQIIAYHYGQPKEHQKKFKPSIFNEIQSGKAYTFQSKLIENGIGYIRIVGLPMGDNQKMAKEIQDLLCAQIEQGANKWIIDLRYNGGGNMHPMAEGIAEIIGNGIAGGSQGFTQSESSTWKIENGDFYYDNYSVQLANTCAVSGIPKIAVLTSVYTASSGEAIAVIFKGRKNTRFFGEKTLGMVTITDWEQIDSLTTMSISVGYYKDRLDKVYKDYVDVDEHISFEPSVPVESDQGISRAITWLREKN